MNIFLIIGILVVLLVVIIGIMVFFLSSSGKNVTANSNGNLRNMLSQQRNAGLGDGLSQDILEKVKEETGRSVAGEKKKVSLATKKFRAGFYTDEDFSSLRVKFLLYRTAPIVVVAFLAEMIAGMMELTAISSLSFTIVGGILGFLMGLKLPESVLDDIIKKRYEEAIYHLPMVVEQLTIGISSGLDMGPCISYVVNMATDRRTHNVVTELFVHIEKLVQAGYSLSEALREVADAFGQKELSHVFMFLAQCAQQGGEVSRQLQDLGESVSLHRQIQVEARIVKLPVKATGPLTMVFAGFFIMLIGSVFITLAQNIKQ
ncbi:MAG: type II secretion system F family protein [Deltaproteobacteria bacterium]|jgi:Flp pilus assembly protein TadB|nr:type II secretion system F family protein [Deltaproteobacteria bacterium]